VLHLSWRAKLTTITLVAIFGFIAWVSRQPVTLETPQEARARQQAQDQATQTQTALTAKKKYLCSIKLACLKYGAVRQECATAGNFETCVEVKMGEPALRFTDECTADGGVQGDTTAFPSTIECYIRKLDD
jgi:hypothetical protein